MKNLNNMSLPQNINPIKMVSKENDLKKVPGKKCKRMIKIMFEQLKEDMDIFQEKQRDE